MVTTLLEPVSGSVRLKLYKGTIAIAGRTSPNSLYEPSLASFDDSESFHHSNATGFVQLLGLPTRVVAKRDATAQNGAGGARAASPGAEVITT